MNNFITGGKYRRFLFLILGLLSLPSIGFSQKNYWQQEVHTKIQVTLDDVHNILRAHLSMNYINHSPDTLRFIEWHLYPNAFKNDRTAFDTQAVEDGNTDFYFSSANEKGYIDSLNFVVDGTSARLQIMKHIDEAKLWLPRPLLPGDSVQIESPFRVKLPHIFSRMGHDSQSYQISQWFPKPAVFDKSGWNNFPYLNQGEYYSEFGSYDVSITVPKNYVVMATGHLVKSAPEKQWIAHLAKIPLPSDTLYENSIPPSSKVFKTLHFHADSVHDFAWFADKRWIVRKDTIVVPESHRVVTAYRCFLPQHKTGWRTSLKAMKAAIHGYIRAVGPYPFKTVKVVEGALMPNAGGMEYPTIAVISSSNDSNAVFTDIVHEVGHNWFYAMLGSNERDYPWMDEGINSFYTNKFAPQGNPGSNFLNQYSFNYLIYAAVSSIHQLQPADTESRVYRPLNYFVDVYEKTPLFLKWLRSYMGASEFRKAMQAYFEDFRFKHPQPEDFKRVFEQHSSKDIRWFFKALQDSRPVDFSVKSVRRHGDSTTIKLANNTGLSGPVLLHLTAKHHGSSTISDTALWTQTFSKNISITVPNPTSEASWREVSIDRTVPDFNEKNNSNKSPLAIRPFGGANFSHHHKIWMLPAIGYNYYDGFMVGLVVHDMTIPQNRFQFALVPLFGTSSRQMGGTGFLSYTKFWDHGWLQNLQINLEGKSFSYRKSDLNRDNFLTARYRKVAPELVFNIRKPFPRSKIYRRLILKGYWIREGSLKFDLNPVDRLYRPSHGISTTSIFGKIRYEYHNRRTFNPYGYALEGQVGKGFAKLSVSGRLRVDYYAKNKSLFLRGYFGKLLDISGDGITDRRYFLSATYSGVNDYLYDQTFLARLQNTGFLANQIAVKEGGFKMNTLQYAQPVGLSSDWLAALNLKTDLPFGKVPIRLFGDLAAVPKTNGSTGVDVIYEAGFSLHLGKAVAVYVPLVLSKQLNDYSKTVLGKNRILKSISFAINFNSIKWTNLFDFTKSLLSN